MSENALSKELRYVGGVGPKVASLFSKLKILTIEDLIYTPPRRYEDRRNLPPIAKIKIGDTVTIRGRLKHVESKPLRGGKVLIRAYVHDGTGVMMLTWFNQHWIAAKLKQGVGDIVAYGTVKGSPQEKEISNPEFEFLEDDQAAEEFARIVPVYGLTDGLSQSLYRKVASTCLQELDGAIEDPLPQSFRKEKRLPSLEWSLLQMHDPENPERLKSSRDRLVFEEFFYAQIALAQRRYEGSLELGIPFPIDDLLAGKVIKDVSSHSYSNAIHTPGKTKGESLFITEQQEALGCEPLLKQIKSLFQFELTNAQKRVVNEIWEDMRRPHPMNRLVQGDVGAGKTAVAACAMLAAAKSHHQAALMAPTEILAEQHFINLKNLFSKANIEVVLLAGKLTAKAKKEAQSRAESGDGHIFVGTQALIADAVEFHKLGLVVVDEQHRFGVMQRAALKDKSHTSPDVLYMTATPIPRTLAQTQFGDLDVSIIDELPPGRKPIKTHWRHKSQRKKVYETVKELVGQGRQVYVVCPLVNESEMMLAQAAEELYQTLSNKIFPNIEMGLLHGKMPTKDKEEVMEKFRRGIVKILVSTTVIEVGVDVPNASVMVIEDANRFGLSQLHQLRGRVGRGSAQSFCILIADATNEIAAERLETMTRTNDGFEIAEKDMELRGPGDVAGTMQAGRIDYRFGDLIRDSVLLSQARNEAKTTVENDPLLQNSDWSGVREKVQERRSKMALGVMS